MSNAINRHPVIGLAVALSSLLAGPLSRILFPLFGNPGTVLALMFGLGCALAGALLGIRSLRAPRQTPSAARGLAVVTIVVGVLLAIVSSFILFMIATPNAPF